MCKSSVVSCHLNIFDKNSKPRMQTHVAAYPVASISGFVTNPTNDYLALMEALVTHGPQVR